MLETSRKSAIKPCAGQGIDVYTFGLQAAAGALLFALQS